MARELLTRDRIINQWFSDHDALVASANLESYEHYTTSATERLGEAPYWELISQDERDEAADNGDAMPDGSYPIRNVDELDNAIHAVGRSGADHDAVRRHIIKRAGELNAKSHVPDNWNADGSLKDDGEDASSLLPTISINLSVPAGMTGAEIAAAYAEAEARGHECSSTECECGTGDTHFCYSTACHTMTAADAAPPAAPPADDAKKAPPAAPAKADDGSSADASVDATVAEAVANAQAAVKRALQLQQDDPDKTDPNDVKVLAGLEQATSILAGVAKDQAADTDASSVPAKGSDASPGSSDASPAAPADGSTPAAASTNGESFAAPPAPADGAPGGATGVEGDADDSGPAKGNIDATAACQNPDCGHFASAHQDTGDGENQGHCTMANCGCPGFVPDADALNNEDDDGSTPQGSTGDQPEGTTNEEDDQTERPVLAADAPPPADDGGSTTSETAPAAPPAAGPAAPQLPAPDPSPEQGVIGPMFTIPVGILEGVETGDGRLVADGALTWRTPPLPLMGLKTSPHDPAGFDMNDPAVLIGRIDTVTRDGSTISAQGHLLATEDGIEWASIIEQMGRMGVSADVAADEVEETMPEMPPGGTIDVLDMLDGINVLHTLVKGEILGFTVCPTPAFPQAYIVLGDGSGESEPLPEPTPEQAAMGLRYVDRGEVECEPCATATSEPRLSLVASSAGGPTAPPSAWFTDPAFTRGDDRLVETIDPRTGRPNGFAAPMTATDSGEVYGHIAQWGVCHIGPQYRGKCMLAPRNSSGYALWYTGTVRTAEGDLVDVGPLTAGTGHAPLNFSAAQTLAHYDHTGTAVAYGVVGEDEFGIWFHGSLSPTATKEQVFQLHASKPSGDWRPMGSRQELVAALMVNRPGFPQVKAHRTMGRITALVAAGSPLFEIEAEPVVLSVEDRIARLESSTAPLIPLAHKAQSDRMAALRGA